MNDHLLKRRVVELREQMAKSIDGYSRDDAREEQINAAFRTALGGRNGEAVMDYLRSITVNTVMPPSASDGELRMQEGMRRLFGIIQTRVSSTPAAKE